MDVEVVKTLIRTDVEVVKTLIRTDLDGLEDADLNEESWIAQYRHNRPVAALTEKWA